MGSYCPGDWLHCKACGLAKTRKQVVLGRGQRPCDLLLIGEAPGKSEDILGIPFIGQSGKLLGKALEAACALAGMPKGLLRVYITNICACRPTDSFNGENRQPSDSEAFACRQRLEAEYVAAAPKKVVFLGKVAERFGKALMPGALALQHPAYILRSGGAGSPVWSRFVRELSGAIKSLLEEKR